MLAELETRILTQIDNNVDDIARRLNFDYKVCYELYN